MDLKPSRCFLALFLGVFLLSEMGLFFSNFLLLIKSGLAITLLGFAVFFIKKHILLMHPKSPRAIEPLPDHSWKITYCNGKQKTMQLTQHFLTRHLVILYLKRRYLSLPVVIFSDSVPANQHRLLRRTLLQHRPSMDQTLSQ